MLSAVRYPVVADPSHEMSAAYGVLLPDGSAVRATFVIDPDGVVRHATFSNQTVGRSPRRPCVCCRPSGPESSAR